MMEGTRRIMLKVDEQLCQVCRKCLANNSCRANAFRRLDREEAPFLDMSRCWGCLDCIPACPFGAVVKHQYQKFRFV